MTVDTDELAAPGTFRRYAWDALSSPRVLQGHFGRRLMGLFSLTADVFAEGLSQTVTMPWVHGNPPPDMLGPLGRDVNLPRYPTETNAQYLARQQRAWEDWETAGSGPTLIAQLATAGFPGGQIIRLGTAWSDFLLFFPQGTHNVTAAGPSYGSFDYGDGTNYGPVGISVVELATLRGIIRKWKPGRYVCRRIVWEISGWTYGSGFSYGDTDLFYGGEQATAGAI